MFYGTDFDQYNHVKIENSSLQERLVFLIQYWYV